VQKFQPSTEGNDTPQAQDNILDKLFNPNAVFFFGHPLRTFHRQAVNGMGKEFGNIFEYPLASGSFNFISPSDGVRLRDNARVLYDHQIRRYYLKLLRTLIANRRVRLCLNKFEKHLPDNAESAGACDDPARPTFATDHHHRSCGVE
jgi:hypothetical protein